MSLPTRLYEIELWSRLGVLLADISTLIKSFSYSMSRNEAEDLQLTMDLNAYEELCASIGTFPTSMLSPYATDIKVKRNGAYLFGAHVGDIITKLDDNEQTIEVRCFGYLNLLIDRYVTKTYTQEYESAIAWDLINETQNQTNGDMGITLGPNQVQIKKRDRKYERQNVKEAIINLTKLQNAKFDVEINIDKKFNTYNMIGDNKTRQIEFIYPRNIKSMSIPRSGLPLFNKIYGLGSGFGEDQLRSIQNDNESQLNYGLHERILVWNSIIDQKALDENAFAQLMLRKDLLEIPQMTVSGVDFDLNTFGIGDRVMVGVEGHPFLQTVNGVYRIEKISVAVDENQAEDITVSFDNNSIDEFGEQDE